MNLADLQSKLIAAARKNAPSDHVPYAFEKRVLTCLTTAPRSDEWALWSRALWLGAGACTAIALLASVWSFSAGDDTDATLSFSQGVEQSLLASADETDPAW